MNEPLTLAELLLLPSGTVIEDAHGDVWSCQPNGLWRLDSQPGYGTSTATRVFNMYSPLRIVP